jgi:hypothetical protein
LWHTLDDGHNWSQYAEKTDLTQPFVVDVANEGRHGFLVVVRTGDVLSRARPSSGDSPMVWVEVDVTPPTLRLFSLEHRVDSDKLVVTWNAHDKNLAAKPISFYYSTSSDGPWQLIATGLENSGRCELDLPETLSGAASPCLRVQAADRAGNFAAAEKPIPHGSIASSRPEGSILRVEPAAGPPH